jgi:hypothetical protein
MARLSVRHPIARARRRGAGAREPGRPTGAALPGPLGSMPGAGRSRRASRSGGARWRSRRGPRRALSRYHRPLHRAGQAQRLGPRGGRPVREPTISCGAGPATTACSEGLGGIVPSAVRAGTSASRRRCSGPARTGAGIAPRRLWLRLAPPLSVTSWAVVVEIPVGRSGSARKDAGRTICCGRQGREYDTQQ